HFYKTAFGFQSLAYSGPETGTMDRVSYVIRQNKLTFVLTTPLRTNNAIADHIYKHGDGVKVLALMVDDATDAWKQTTSRGGKSYLEPKTLTDDNGVVVLSGIHTYGDTVHLFVERKNYNGVFMPGFRKWESNYNPEPVGLKFIDHMVGNVGWGEMNTWVKWYEDVMGFVNFLSFDDKQIHTEYSALMSKVMSNGNGRIKFPINEPAVGKKRSQIEEYIDFYEGPGAQHIAVATDDIISTVTQLRARGVEFLSAPPQSYYDEIPARLGVHMEMMKEDLKVLQSLSIMIDADEEGYLLQIFTKPVEDRPTLFFEIIQRMGARGFGAGNFKALFESIEREQEKRGTL
ncbi:MAG: 4-hydroxyphenylpyruvate dioxygenase, partial [Crocinitomicaceae bacterium]|nr:4-hydroxyphenylpyruvate dioxygenase [Crocinitomicaceae bacterium]